MNAARRPLSASTTAEALRVLLDAEPETLRQSLLELESFERTWIGLQLLWGLPPAEALDAIGMAQHAPAGETLPIGASHVLDVLQAAAMGIEQDEAATLLVTKAAALGIGHRQGDTFGAHAVRYIAWRHRGALKRDTLPPRTLGVPPNRLLREYAVALVDDLRKTLGLELPRVDYLWLEAALSKAGPWTGKPPVDARAKMIWRLTHVRAALGLDNDPREASIRRADKQAMLNLKKSTERSLEK